MAQQRDDQFHQDRSFSEGDAPRPGGEADEALRGMGEAERPITTGGPGVLHSDAERVGQAADRQSERMRKGSPAGESVDEEVAGEFLDPLPERHRPKGDDPEGTMADYNRGEGRVS